jgi:bifunctional UDP-N-acetylglucosamine pyrophosphorylase/glucosamine-1-phosphate N-acetyltransferase
MPILQKKISTIILAAGVGKRMKSKTPKILHPVLGKPIISFVVDLARDVGSSQIILVISNRSEDLFKSLGEKISYAIQEEPLGSGDAARKGLKTAEHENALILCGDVPLLRRQTLLELVEYHMRKNADATVLTCEVNDPRGYGRVIRNRNGYIVEIIEQTDATTQQQKIMEINAGVYYGKTELLRSALEQVTTDNKQCEYYLTDAIRNIASARKKVAAYRIGNEKEIIGVNTQAQLAQVRAIVKSEWYEQLMQRGVYIEDPATVDIDLSVKIGGDAHIRPHTLLEGATIIGDGERVGPFVWIKDGKKIKISDGQH